MNDRDVEIVARNSLLVMTAFWFSPADAAQMMLHLWYSAFLPASMLDTLKETLSPMIQDVCAKIASRSLATLQRKTWSNGSRSLCLALRKAAWNNLLSFLNVPDSLTVAAARDLRTAVTLAEERKDYLDRAIFRQPPAKRVAMMRFREDGLLLPFGSPRAAYDTPNPYVSIVSVFSVMSLMLL